jgi:hypothetical protein
MLFASEYVVVSPPPKVQEVTVFVARFDPPDRTESDDSSM